MDTEQLRRTTQVLMLNLYRDMQDLGLSREQRVAMMKIIQAHVAARNELVIELFHVTL